MSKVFVTESYLDDIADAIRGKNGTENTYKPSQMAAAITALPDPAVLDDKTIAANGTYDPSDDNLDGYSEVTVNVPNSYAAGDEGKVVSNGSLVAQSARSSDITENGTYDTTLNNEVTVDVSGGGGGDTYIQNPPIGITTQDNTNLLNIQDGWIGEFLSEKSTFFPIDDQGNTLDVDWSKPFEICVPFKYSQNMSRSMVLFGSEGGGFFYTPSIELASNGGGIWCGFSTNGTNWGYSIAFTSSDGISLQANKKYTVKATWDGTDYTVSVDDGDTKITKSITPTSAHYHSSNNKIVFGGMMRSSYHNARYVKMYLPEMYIISEGTKVWKGIQNGGNCMPTGSVIYYAGLTAPSGYLVCDGTVYNIADYSDLSTFIETNYGEVNYFGGNGTTTFAVPDWRGEFFRAAGTNSRSGQGSGGTVGQHQDQTMQNRLAANKNENVAQLQGNTSGWISVDNPDAEEKSNTHYWMNVSSGNSGLDANVSQRYAARPTNTSLLVCIKT